MKTVLSGCSFINGILTVDMVITLCSLNTANIFLRIMAVEIVIGLNVYIMTWVTLGCVGLG